MSVKGTARARPKSSRRTDLSKVKSEKLVEEA